VVRRVSNLPEIDGLLVLDKPAGMTSRAVVDRVQRWFPRKTRIGHAGTLDPLATGVLVLGLGEATRLIEYIQRMNKVYRTRFLLGFRSDSDDADGVVTPVPGAVAADAAKVAECVAAFIGTIEQVPPVYSAAKVAGRRAYYRARRGEEVSLSPRPVQIHAIEIRSYSYPNLDLEVCCGKGTYIRSLARDIGECLGCGALVQSLRRTRIGPFTVEEALTLDMEAETARSHMVPMEMALVELPQLVLSEDERKRLGQGQAVALAGVPEGMEKKTEVAVLDGDSRLTAVALFDPQRQMLLPVKVLQSKKR
jgi:tRNA pseudouridine55 synthase